MRGRRSQRAGAVGLQAESSGPGPAAGDRVCGGELVMLSAFGADWHHLSLEDVQRCRRAGGAHGWPVSRRAR